MVAMLVISFVGCHRQQQPVVINIAMPANATPMRPIGERIVAFSERRPTTRSGRAIVVQEVYPREATFAQFIALNHDAVDIIVGDSRHQIEGLTAVLPAATANVCDTGECPAIIAPWVREDKKDAAQQVFRAITGSATR